VLNGQPRKAIDLYKKARERLPDSWEVENDLAFMLAQYSDSDKDIDYALTIAEKLNAKHVNSYSIKDTLGWIWFKKKDYGKATRYLKEALILNTDDPSIKYHLGMTEYNMGNVETAKRLLTEAYKSSQNFPEKEEALKILKTIR
jgi:tetratricopeptide (TPR) repeat protein